MTKASVLASRQSLTFFGVASAALVADIGAVVALAYNRNPIEAAALHVGALAVAALWAYANKTSDDERAGVFLFPALVLAGPFGAVFCLLAALTNRLGAVDAVPPSQWIESLFACEEDGEIARLHERIVERRDDFSASGDVIPFRDILAGGSVLQKQKAIAKIAAYFQPKFAPLLLQAARHPNAAVRVQAATALTKIEHAFMQRHIRLETAAKDKPDHHPARIALAAFYDEYAHTSLMDEESRRDLRAKAIAFYQASLARKDDTGKRIKIARLLLRQGLSEDARRWLEPVIQTTAAEPSALHWYMEALFNLKRFADLRAFAKQHAQALAAAATATPGPIGDLLGVWTVPGAAGSAENDAKARHAA